LSNISNGCGKWLTGGWSGWHVTNWTFVKRWPSSGIIILPQLSQRSSIHRPCTSRIQFSENMVWAILRNYYAG
jgi:hypothetical protein